MTCPLTLIVSVDAEEDNWLPTRTRITVDNIRELPRLDRCFQELGVRATYFVTYQVVIEPRAAGVLSEIRARGAAEIAAHVHPWNTPPLDEPTIPGHTMMVNLPQALQVAKIRSVTEALTNSLGERPTAFRAGRWGFGQSTAAALLECGYAVDSSITPFQSWEEHGRGPTHLGAPVGMYRLDGRGDVRVPVPGGPLCEVPLSMGYSRRPWALWGRVHMALTWPPLRGLRLVGVASRLSIVKFICLSPELESAADMLTLARHLVRLGVRHLHLTLHSPSLRPGLTPFARTEVDIERIYATLETFVTSLSGMVDVRCATVSEAVTALMPSALAAASSGAGTSCAHVQGAGDVGR